MIIQRKVTTSFADFSYVWVSAVSVCLCSYVLIKDGLHAVVLWTVSRDTGITPGDLELIDQGSNPCLGWYYICQIWELQQMITVWLKTKDTYSLIDLVAGNSTLLLASLLVVVSNCAG